ncbi:MAG: hypothetical protein Q4E12_00460 [Coriobacteriia bacterium]|nr:hypothetical protein [Coriobacteriia bacterium]
MKQGSTTKRCNTSGSTQRKALTAIIVVVLLAAIAGIVCFALVPHDQASQSSQDAANVTSNEAPNNTSNTSNSSASNATSNTNSPTSNTAASSNSKPASYTTSSSSSSASNGGSGSNSEAPQANTDPADKPSDNPSDDPEKRIIEYFPHENATREDLPGYYELTEEVLGKTLAEGVRFKVSKDLVIDGRTTGTNGFTANNNVIYVERGVTLTVYGADGEWSNGGLAAILLPDGKSLCFTGEGTVNCYGGSAGKGSDGAAGKNGFHNEVDRNGNYFGGQGGDGGGGGGGAGAGIGTDGGQGGGGGSGGANVGAPRAYEDKYQSDGYAGNSGATGTSGATCGYLYVAGAVSIHLYGGNKGLGGAGGEAGVKDVSSYAGHNFNSGGGGGAGGSAAPGFGCGGPGGGGGAGGGGGGIVWKRHRLFSDDEQAPMASGGAGGLAVGIDAGRSAGGETGKGERSSVGQWDGGEGGTNASQQEAPTTTVSSERFCALNTSIVVAYAWGTSGNVSGPTWYREESQFANAYNNGAWYTQNRIEYNQGQTADGTTEVSFYTIVGSTKTSAVAEILSDSSLFPQREGYTFTGYALKVGEDTVKVYDATTGEIDYGALYDAGLCQGADASHAGMWQGWGTQAFFAQWDSNGINTYTIEYCANGGTFVDTETGTLLGADYYDDPGYACNVATPLWDNFSIGACQIIAPDGYQLSGWAAHIDASGNAIGTVYAPGREVTNLGNPGDTVKMYAIWEKAASTSSASSEIDAYEDEIPQPDGCESDDKSEDLYEADTAKEELDGATPEEPCVANTPDPDASPNPDLADTNQTPNTAQEPPSDEQSTPESNPAALAITD